MPDPHDATDDQSPDEPREPGSPGVVGEQPNRTDAQPGSGALDEHPDGRTPHDIVDEPHGDTPPGS